MKMTRRVFWLTQAQAEEITKETQKRKKKDPRFTESALLREILTTKKNYKTFTVSE